VVGVMLNFDCIRRCISCTEWWCSRWQEIQSVTVVRVEGEIFATGEWSIDQGQLYAVSL